MTQSPRSSALLALLGAAACHRWSSATPAITECDWPTWSHHASASAPGDLSPARAYRNYLAVSHVEPIAEHFVLWSPGEMKEVRAVRDLRGGTIVELEGGMEGGVGYGPVIPPAIPADVAPLAHDLEAELHGHCPELSSYKLEYKGRYRRVTVQEFIALDTTPRTAAARAGWFANYQIQMDESLQRILGSAGYMHGVGQIEVAHDAQWLAVPPGNATKLALVNDGAASLASEIADAAQRFDHRAPGPTLASLVPADAPLLPPGYTSRIVARVHLLARPATPRAPSAKPDTGPTPKTDADLAAPIEIDDAVFSTGASGEAEAQLVGHRYLLRANLVPDAPLTPSPGPHRGEFRGTLTLQISDDQGRSWQHAYPAHGPLDLEDHTVAAPWGLSIPGASWPSPEADALRGELPGFGPYRVIEIRVDIQTHFDPRPGR